MKISLRPTASTESRNSGKKISKRLNPNASLGTAEYFRSVAKKPLLDQN